MFAVGIDVSNGRSTVAVLRFKTQAVCKPFEVAHTAEGLVALVETLNTLDSEVRQRSPDLPLTIGKFCGSILPWIQHDTN